MEVREKCNVHVFEKISGEAVDEPDEDIFDGSDNEAT